MKSIFLAAFLLCPACSHGGGFTALMQSETVGEYIKAIIDFTAE